ncbi:hypothetical protein E1264_36435 [Actinomadura sp. KC216]|uniref:DUF6891 domain-containing protein n=1 Tax=Actinomadura sp. KC216 TaxID=2530370 RepID=UPI00104E1228|nr:hypothetical protein [Actinomadura sp. KC216]TDB78798.1 hypothetical protein E1264_36435 [Actinomadura sp. KC216]
MSQQLREHIRVRLALGKDDFDTIVERAAECMDDTPDVTSLAREIAAEEFAAYLADQRTWPDVTDSDRLLRAFRDLDMSGIVARADFSCCQNCGISEVGGEVPDGEQRRGYTFCHRQDMETAVSGGGLMLAYGIFKDADEPSTQPEIGEEVAGALRRHGLTVGWDGDPRRRIEVDVTYRRRRAGHLATWPDGPAAPVPDADRLDVTYSDYAKGRNADAPVPMTLAEARGVLLELTPYPDNFAVFVGRSDGAAQVMWEAGPRLWLEFPDPVARRFHGRHVTMAEAEEIISVLAVEDRVALDLLPGHTTENWG